MSFRTDLGLPDSPPPGTMLVHFFRTRGKWYTSEDVPIVRRSLVVDQLSASLEAEIGDRLRGMLAVCLESDHPNDHPCALIYDELDCAACSFEAEFGTRDCPHPVSERVHSCVRGRL